MSFNPGDRVRTTAQVGSIPAGSTGTVVTSGPATSGVRFDIQPANVVVVPNHLLAPAGAAAGGMLSGSIFAATSLDHEADTLPEGFVWLTPRVLTPQTASREDVIATPNVGALSVLFEGATVALRGRRRSGAWFVVAEFPVSGGPASVRGHVRGDALQGADAQATIVVTIGGTARTIELRGATNGTITEEVSAVVEGPVVPIAISIVASRQSNDEESLITVDALDLAAE